MRYAHSQAAAAAGGELARRTLAEARRTPTRAGAGADGGALLPPLDDAFDVPLEQRLEFAREGVVLLRGIVPELKEYAPALRHAWAHGTREYSHAEIRRLGCGEELLARAPDGVASGDEWTELDEQGEIDVALDALAAAEECAQEEGENLKYFQALHLRRYNPAVAQWALSSRLASAASQLLGAGTCTRAPARTCTPTRSRARAHSHPNTRAHADVRLYQDGFFRKGDSKGRSIEILNDPTNIHRELDLIPVQTDAYVTAWCPLRPIDTARNDSALFFFPRTHRHMSADRAFQEPFQKLVERVEHVLEWTAKRFDDQRKKERRELEGLEDEDELEEEADEGSDYSDSEASSVHEEFTRSLDPQYRDEFSYLWKYAALRKEPIMDWNFELSEHTHSVMSRYCHGETYGEALSEEYGVAEGFGWNCAASPFVMERNKRLIARYRRVGYSQGALDNLQKNFDADAAYAVGEWMHAFDYGKYEVGDCSFHHGWTFHAAPVSASKMAQR